MRHFITTHRIVYQQNVLAFLDYDRSYDCNTVIVLAAGGHKPVSKLLHTLEKSNKDVALLRADAVVVDEGDEEAKDKSRFAFQMRQTC